jgi:hypothetical protein
LLGWKVRFIAHAFKIRMKKGRQSGRCRGRR